MIQKDAPPAAVGEVSGAKVLPDHQLQAEAKLESSEDKGGQKQIKMPAKAALPPNKQPAGSNMNRTLNSRRFKNLSHSSSKAIAYLQEKTNRSVDVQNQLAMNNQVRDARNISMIATKRNFNHSTIDNANKTVN